MRNRAYASYLLSRQGILVSGALSDIRERYENYFKDAWQDDLGAAYLAASYKLLKQDRQADALFRKVPWRSLVDKWDSDGLYYDPLVHDAEHLHLLARHFPSCWTMCRRRYWTNSASASTNSVTTRCPPPCCCAPWITMASVRKAT